MKEKYILVRSKYFNGALTRTSYGIALVTEEEGITYVIRTVDDLSSNKKSVQQLVDRCNIGRLSPLHLDDVIEDFLTADV